MRLHRLTVSAFGPFARTEHVDFDELNRAGLFLMTGATGAGKSSLLDAVCFALYGTVPGARGVKALKSQHARADAQPHVVLDFSVQGRRFVVRRTPEWSRPKRRGEGLLVEKASALITETTTGSDHFLSSRAAEVGLLVSDLMGMNATQFAQVALLPQGEFQTFLRASSQDRHDVLQQLFRTDRFAAIEEFVSGHSKRLRDQASAGASTVQRILDTVADRARAELPPDLTGEALPSAAAAGRVLPWVTAVQGSADASAGLAKVAGDEAAATLATRRSRHQESALRAHQRRGVEEARAALSRLGDSEHAALATRAALSADDRAARCRPALALLAQQGSACQVAAVRAETAVRALRQSPALGSGPSAGSAPGSGSVHVPDPVSATDLAGLAETVRTRAARLTALLPRAQAADGLRRQRDEERRLLRSAELEQQVTIARAAEIPVELAARTARLGAVAALAARGEALTVSRDAATTRQGAAAQLEVLRGRLPEVEDLRRDARDTAQDARQRVQDLMARRLAGMAAELAGALVPGSACQVCGSLEHPRPASSAGDAVTVSDQEAAAAELRHSEARVDAADAALHTLRSELHSVTAGTGGLSLDEATAAVAALETAQAEATEAVRDKRTLEAEVAELRTEQETLAARRLEAASVVAGLQAAVAVRGRSLAEIEREVDEALAAHGEPAAMPDVDPETRPESASDRARDRRPGVGDVLASLDALLRLLVDAQRATAALDEADTRLRAVTEQALEVAGKQGFVTLAEVETAVLPLDARRRSLALLEERSTAEARARAVLEDPAVQTDDAGETATDLDLLVGSLAALVHQAEGDAVEAARRLALEEDRSAALAMLAGRLDVAVQAWAPVRDDALRADALSKLVRGMGQDNQLQMRLSAYVLATRLDQVVAAANERLGHMRDQRYVLQRTGRAERRTSQAGLGLDVVDQWTGDVRAPTTLSGGETFVVSLSLALGLADVVTQESGGTEIETLFIDEGFGTLDADTLDDVMDRLDGLRAGGRTVGVVSHVTELRSRIPTQVQVEKGRSGSTVTVRTLVG